MTCGGGGLETDRYFGYATAIELLDGAGQVLTLQSARQEFGNLLAVLLIGRGHIVYPPPAAGVISGRSKRILGELAHVILASYSGLGPPHVALLLREVMPQIA
jgi:hypothetical protein